jgi:allophanate hydrolase subunit 1
MPGFTYLGGLPEAIHTSRRTTPRQKTPPRSVSIGGKQAAVSPPMAIPSAWQMLGQTPVRVYDPRRADRPFLLASGDHVRFEPVKEAEYKRLCALAESGETVAQLEEIASPPAPSAALAPPLEHP